MKVRLLAFEKAENGRQEQFRPSNLVVIETLNSITFWLVSVAGKLFWLDFELNEFTKIYKKLPSIRTTLWFGWS